MHVFGATLYAVSVTTALFLGGLSLGALLCGHILASLSARRLSLQSLIALYAWLELGTGVLGLIVPCLLSAQLLPSLLPLLGQPGDTPTWLSYLLRFVFASCVLLPPTALMGATLPVLSQCFARLDKDVEKDAGFLLSANTAGAVAGALLSGFCFLPGFGLSATTWIAAAINLSLFAGVISGRKQICARLEKVLPQPVCEKRVQQTGLFGKESAEPPTSLPVVSAVAFLSGFLALMIQVSWTRLFSLLFGSSVYCLSCVLSIFLLGLASGSFIASALLRFIKQPLIAIALVYMFCASSIIGSLYFADEMPWTTLAFERMLSWSSVSLPLWACLGGRAILAVLIMFPAATAMGAVLPLLFKAAGPGVSDTASKVSIVYAGNTLGCVLGSCLTGFVFIPTFSRLCLSGMQTSILLAACGQMALAAVLCAIWFKSFIDDAPTQIIVNTIVFVLTGAVIADVFCFRPSWNPAIMSAGATFYTPAQVSGLDRQRFLRELGVFPQGSRTGSSGVLFYREGLNTTVTVGSDPSRNVIYLKNDGKVEAAVPLDPSLPAIGGDQTTQILLGALPVLFHEGPCRKVFVIGCGTGTTAGAISRFKEVTDLTVCELETAVLDARKFFTASSGDPFSLELTAQGRVRLLVNDARYTLTSSAESFDVITSQPSDPWVSGSSELFTAEFFQIARARLKKNGIFCQWIQLYSLEPAYLGVLLRTFAEVFPDARVFLAPGAGEIILLGSNESCPDGRNRCSPDQFQLPEHLRSERKTGSEPADLALRWQSPEVRGLLLRCGVHSRADLRALGKLSGKSARDLGRELSKSGGELPLNTDENLQVEFAAATSALTQDERIEQNRRAIEDFIKNSAAPLGQGQPTN